MDADVGWPRKDFRACLTRLSGVFTAIALIVFSACSWITNGKPGY